VTMSISMRSRSMNPNIIPMLPAPDDGDGDVIDVLDVEDF